MRRILFIVPALNERENLPGVLSDIRQHYADADVVIVDDGSTDGTAAWAKSAGVRVLQMPFNVGIGAAVQTGLMYAAAGGYDVAIQFDGDGQHQAGQVAALLGAVDRGADVAMGSRFLSGDTYRAPLLRRVGMRVLNSVNSFILGQHITDSTSGFRAYTAPAIAFLAREYPHDYPEPEAVLTLIRDGFTVEEVAVQMRQRQEGRSSITLAKAIFYMMKVLVAIGVGATRRAGRRTDESSDPDYRYCR